MLMALGAGVPAVAVALIYLWSSASPSKLQWTLTVLIIGVWWGMSIALKEQVARPLQTLSNLLGALREGDYSIRARGAGAEEALGLAMLEANVLAKTLRDQRLGALEATALLRKVMDEIDVAVFAFDGDHVLRLVNRAGERLLAESAGRLIGHGAEEIGVQGCLEGSEHQIVDEVFPGGHGKWDVRRSTFRQEGLVHQLLVVSDLSRTLREEERQAWRRLVRVLRHEINNSLAPIKSLAGSLKDIVGRRTMCDDWESDLEQGLDVISDRAEALTRFMASYAKLTQLPGPVVQPVDIGSCVKRVVDLERRKEVEIREGPELTIQADSVQLEQLLINLVRNAVDAVEETDGGVFIDWMELQGRLELRVVDEGEGLADTANLFVPFYTTKPEGSGIGLVLSRQIAEAHGGSLTLRNRDDAEGCEARLNLPV